MPEGLSLRDYFAAKAMIALMSNPAWVTGLDRTAKKDGFDFKHGVAVHAYRLADAMLKERLNASDAE